MKKIAVIAFLAFISTTLFAKVKLPGVLADNMVLQQQSQVKLWGEAKPGSIVNIKPSSEKYGFVRDNPIWKCRYKGSTDNR